MNAVMRMRSTGVLVFLSCAVAPALAQVSEDRTTMPAVCSERDVNCVLDQPLTGSTPPLTNGTDTGSTRSGVDTPATKVLVPERGSGAPFIVVPPAAPSR